MSLWTRLRRIFAARANSALDRIEDPVQSLDAAYRSQLAALEDGRRGVADVLTGEKRLEIEVHSLDAALARATETATAAVARGDDDAARRALEREAFVSEQQERLRDEIAGLRTQRGELENLVERLGRRVERLRTEKLALAARHAAANASARAGASVTGLTEDTAEIARMVERARDRSRDVQARAAALVELAGASTNAPSSDAVAARLAALKANLATHPQLGDGSG